MLVESLRREADSVEGYSRGNSIVLIIRGNNKEALIIRYKLDTWVHSDFAVVPLWSLIDKR